MRRGAPQRPRPRTRRARRRPRSRHKERSPWCASTRRWRVAGQDPTGQDPIEDIAIAALTHVFKEVAGRLPAIDPRDTAIDERARRIVDTLWEFYGGPRYFAAAEILMGTRQQEALHERVRACRLALAAAYRDMWDRLMGDPDERRHLLEFVIATLHGLALLHLDEHDPQLFDPTLVLLIQLIAAVTRAGMITTSLHNRAHPTPAEPHAPPILA